MTSRVDLSELEIVDAHSHALPTSILQSNDTEGFIERLTMTGMCLKSAGYDDRELDALVRSFSDTTPVINGMMAALATFLGCESSRAEVNRCRRERIGRDPTHYLQSLMTDAKIAGLVIDDGYPQPRIAPETIVEEYARPVASVVRIEPLIAGIVKDARDWRDLRDRFIADLEGAVARSVAAVKSIIAYRTGLDIVEWPEARVIAGFEKWRQANFKESRDHSKPVRDALLHDALAIAKKADIPFHIHSGGGDADIVLEYAQPRNLFSLLKSHYDQDIVLIHSGWPWTSEAAYIASILPRVYLETSLATPWASLAIDQRLATMLGIAPPAKIIYGSDASSEPEVLWFSARTARTALGRVLTDGVDRGWMDQKEALAIGKAVLSGNVRRLHKLAF
jgi:predicted TIM-barrel fold metal-dependent hydrolase